MFKFQIGQLVAFRAGVAEAILCCKATGQFNRFPACYSVVEQRITQECPGGPHLKYVVQGSGTIQETIENTLVGYDGIDIGSFHQAMDEYRKREDV